MGSLIICLWVNDKIFFKALKACIRNIGQVKKDRTVSCVKYQNNFPELNPGREGTQWLLYTTLSQRAGMKNNFHFAPHHVAMGCMSWKWVKCDVYIKNTGSEHEKKPTSEPILYYPHAVTVSL